MNRLLVVAVAAIAGAAIWRRREIRSDAERASQALASAADSARSRIRSGPDDDEGGVDGVGDSAVGATEDDAGELPDSAESTASIG